mmetsp:Transcript_16987/g.27318  ORF Transcript_16987/g.27318 Transcript_16987/m.27318 type:complete len:230 (-) Transcript_16987:22-711(-)
MMTEAKIAVLSLSGSQLLEVGIESRVSDVTQRVEAQRLAAGTVVFATLVSDGIQLEKHVALADIRSPAVQCVLTYAHWDDLASEMESNERLRLAKALFKARSPKECRTNCCKLQLVDAALLLKDSDPALRCYAISSLTLKPSSAASYLAQLVELLEDPNEKVFRKVLGALKAFAHSLGRNFHTHVSEFDSLLERLLSLGNSGRLGCRELVSFLHSRAKFQRGTHYDSLR